MPRPSRNCQPHGTPMGSHNPPTARRSLRKHPHVRSLDTITAYTATLSHETSTNPKQRPTFPTRPKSHITPSLHTIPHRHHSQTAQTLYALISHKRKSFTHKHNISTTQLRGFATTILPNITFDRATEPTYLELSTPAVFGSPQTFRLHTPKHVGKVNVLKNLSFAHLLQHSQSSLIQRNLDDIAFSLGDNIITRLNEKRRIQKIVETLDTNENNDISTGSDTFARLLKKREEEENPQHLKNNESKKGNDLENIDKSPEPNLTQALHAKLTPPPPSSDKRVPYITNHELISSELNSITIEGVYFLGQVDRKYKNMNIYVAESNELLSPTSLLSNITAHTQSSDYSPLTAAAAQAAHPPLHPLIAVLLQHAALSPVEIRSGGVEHVKLLDMFDSLVPQNHWISSLFTPICSTTRISQQNTIDPVSIYSLPHVKDTLHLPHPYIQNRIDPKLFKPRDYNSTNKKLLMMSNTVPYQGVTDTSPFLHQTKQSLQHLLQITPNSILIRGKLREEDAVLIYHSIAPVTSEIGEDGVHKIIENATFIGGIYINEVPSLEVSFVDGLDQASGVKREVRNATPSKMINVVLPSVDQHDHTVEAPFLHLKFHLTAQAIEPIDKKNNQNTNEKLDKTVVEDNKLSKNGKHSNYSKNLTKRPQVHWKYLLVNDYYTTKYNNNNIHTLYRQLWSPAVLADVDLRYGTRAGTIEATGALSLSTHSRYYLRHTLLYFNDPLLKLLNYRPEFLTILDKYHPHLAQKRLQRANRRTAHQRLLGLIRHSTDSSSGGENGKKSLQNGEYIDFDDFDSDFDSDDSSSDTDGILNANDNEMSKFKLVDVSGGGKILTADHAHQYTPQEMSLLMANGLRSVNYGDTQDKSIGRRYKEHFQIDDKIQFKKEINYDNILSNPIYDKLTDQELFEVLHGNNEPHRIALFESFLPAPPNVGGVDDPHNVHIHMNHFTSYAYQIAWPSISNALFGCFNPLTDDLSTFFHLSNTITSLSQQAQKIITRLQTNFNTVEIVSLVQKIDFDENGNKKITIMTWVLSRQERDIKKNIISTTPTLKSNAHDDFVYGKDQRNGIMLQQNPTEAKLLAKYEKKEQKLLGGKNSVKNMLEEVNKSTDLTTYEQNMTNSGNIINSLSSTIESASQSLSTIIQKNKRLHSDPLYTDNLNQREKEHATHLLNPLFEMTNTFILTTITPPPVFTTTPLPHHDPNYIANEYAKKQALKKKKQFEEELDNQKNNFVEMDENINSHEGPELYDENGERILPYTTQKNQKSGKKRGFFDKLLNPSSDEQDPTYKDEQLLRMTDVGAAHRLALPTAAVERLVLPWHPPLDHLLVPRKQGFPAPHALRALIVNQMPYIYNIGHRLRPISGKTVWSPGETSNSLLDIINGETREKNMKLRNKDLVGAKQQQVRETKQLLMRFPSFSFNLPETNKIYSLISGDYNPTQLSPSIAKLHNMNIAPSIHQYVPFLQAMEKNMSGSTKNENGQIEVTNVRDITSIVDVTQLAPFIKTDELYHMENNRDEIVEPLVDNIEFDIEQEILQTEALYQSLETSVMKYKRFRYVPMYDKVLEQVYNDLFENYMIPIDWEKNNQHDRRAWMDEINAILSSTEVGSDLWMYNIITNTLKDISTQLSEQFDTLTKNEKMRLESKQKRLVRYQQWYLSHLHSESMKQLHDMNHPSFKNLPNLLPSFNKVVEENELVENVFDPDLHSNHAARNEKYSKLSQLPDYNGLNLPLTKQFTARTERKLHFLLLLKHKIAELQQKCNDYYHSVQSPQKSLETDEKTKQFRAEASSSTVDNSLFVDYNLLIISYNIKESEKSLLEQLKIEKKTGAQAVSMRTALIPTLPVNTMQLQSILTGHFNEYIHYSHEFISLLCSEYYPKLYPNSSLLQFLQHRYSQMYGKSFTEILQFDLPTLIGESFQQVRSIPAGGQIKADISAISIQPTRLPKSHLSKSKKSSSLHDNDDDDIEENLDHYYEAHNNGDVIEVKFDINVYVEGVMLYVSEVDYINDAYDPTGTSSSTSKLLWDAMSNDKSKTNKHSFKSLIHASQNYQQKLLHSDSPYMAMGRSTSMKDFREKKRLYEAENLSNRGGNAQAIINMEKLTTKQQQLLKSNDGMIHPYDAIESHDSLAPAHKRQWASLFNTAYDAPGHTNGQDHQTIRQQAEHDLAQLSRLQSRFDRLLAIRDSKLSALVKQREHAIEADRSKPMEDSWIEKQIRIHADQERAKARLSALEQGDLQDVGIDQERDEMGQLFQDDYFVGYTERTHKQGKYGLDQVFKRINLYNNALNTQQSMANDNIIRESSKNVNSGDYDSEDDEEEDHDPNKIPWYDDPTMTFDRLKLVFNQVLHDSGETPEKFSNILPPNTGPQQKHQKTLASLASLPPRTDSYAIYGEDGHLIAEIDDEMHDILNKCNKIIARRRAVYTAKPHVRSNNPHMHPSDQKTHKILEENYSKHMYYLYNEHEMEKGTQKLHKLPLVAKASFIYHYPLTIDRPGLKDQLVHKLATLRQSIKNIEQRIVTATSETTPQYPEGIEKQRRVLNPLSAVVFGGQGGARAGGRGLWNELLIIEPNPLDKDQENIEKQLSSTEKQLSKSSKDEEGKIPFPEVNHRYTQTPEPNVLNFINRLPSDRELMAENKLLSNNIYAKSVIHIMSSYGIDMQYIIEKNPSVLTVNIKNQQVRLNWLKLLTTSIGIDVEKISQDHVWRQRSYNTFQGLEESFKQKQKNAKARKTYTPKRGDTNNPLSTWKSATDVRNSAQSQVYEQVQSIFRPKPNTITNFLPQSAPQIEDAAKNRYKVDINTGNPLVPDDTTSLDNIFAAAMKYQHANSDIHTENAITQQWLKSHLKNIKIDLEQLLLLSNANKSVLNMIYQLLDLDQNVLTLFGPDSFDIDVMMDEQAETELSIVKRQRTIKKARNIRRRLDNIQKYEKIENAAKKIFGDDFSDFELGGDEFFDKDGVLRANIDIEDPQVVSRLDTTLQIQRSKMRKQTKKYAKLYKGLFDTDTSEDGEENTDTNKNENHQISEDLGKSTKFNKNKVVVAPGEALDEIATSPSSRVLERLPPQFGQTKSDYRYLYHNDPYSFSVFMKRLTLSDLNQENVKFHSINHLRDYEPEEPTPYHNKIPHKQFIRYYDAGVGVLNLTYFQQLSVFIHQLAQYGFSNESKLNTINQTDPANFLREEQIKLKSQYPSPSAVIKAKGRGALSVNDSGDFTITDFAIRPEDLAGDPNFKPLFKNIKHLALNEELNWVFADLNDPTPQHMAENNPIRLMQTAEFDISDYSRPSEAESIGGIDKKTIYAGHSLGELTAFASLTLDFNGIINMQTWEQRQSAMETGVARSIHSARAGTGGNGSKNNSIISVIDKKPELPFVQRKYMPLINPYPHLISSLHELLPDNPNELKLQPDGSLMNTRTGQIVTQLSADELMRRQTVLNALTQKTQKKNDLTLADIDVDPFKLLPERVQKYYISHTKAQKRGHTLQLQRVLGEHADTGTIDSLGPVLKTRSGVLLTPQRHGSYSHQVTQQHQQYYLLKREYVYGDSINNPEMIGDINNLGDTVYRGDVANMNKNQNNRHPTLPRGLLTNAARGQIPRQYQQQMLDDHAQQTSIPLEQWLNTIFLRGWLMQSQFDSNMYNTQPYRMIAVDPSRIQFFHNVVNTDKITVEPAEIAIAKWWNYGVEQEEFYAVQFSQLPQIDWEQLEKDFGLDQSGNPFNDRPKVRKLDGDAEIDALLHNIEEMFAFTEEDLHGDPQDAARMRRIKKREQKYSYNDPRGAILRRQRHLYRLKRLRNYIAAQQRIIPEDEEFNQSHPPLPTKSVGGKKREKKLYAALQRFGADHPAIKHIMSLHLGDIDERNSDKSQKMVNFEEEFSDEELSMLKEAIGDYSDLDSDDDALVTHGFSAPSSNVLLNPFNISPHTTKKGLWATHMLGALRRNAALQNKNTNHALARLLASADPRIERAMNIDLQFELGNISKPRQTEEPEKTKEELELQGLEQQVIDYATEQTENVYHELQKTSLSYDNYFRQALGPKAFALLNETLNEYAARLAAIREEADKIADSYNVPRYDTIEDILAAVKNGTLHLPQSLAFLEQNDSHTVQKYAQDVFGRPVPLKVPIFKHNLLDPFGSDPKVQTKMLLARVEDKADQEMHPDEHAVLVEFVKVLRAEEDNLFKIASREGQSGLMERYFQLEKDFAELDLSQFFDPDPNSPQNKATYPELTQLYNDHQHHQKLVSQKVQQITSTFASKRRKSAKHPKTISRRKAAELDRKMEELIDAVELSPVEKSAKTVLLETDVAILGPNHTTLTPNQKSTLVKEHLIRREQIRRDKVLLSRHQIDQSQYVEPYTSFSTRRPTPRRKGRHSTRGGTLFSHRSVSQLQLAALLRAETLHMTEENGIMNRQISPFTLLLIQNELYEEDLVKKGQKEPKLYQSMRQRSYSQLHPDSPIPSRYLKSSSQRLSELERNNEDKITRTQQLSAKFAEFTPRVHYKLARHGNFGRSGEQRKITMRSNQNRYKNRINYFNNPNKDSDESDGYLSDHGPEGTIAGHDVNFKSSDFSSTIDENTIVNNSYDSSKTSQATAIIDLETPSRRKVGSKTSAQNKSTFSLQPLFDKEKSDKIFKTPQNRQHTLRFMKESRQSAHIAAITSSSPLNNFEKSINPTNSFKTLKPPNMSQIYSEQGVSPIFDSRTGKIMMPGDQEKMEYQRELRRLEYQHSIDSKSPAKDIFFPFDENESPELREERRILALQRAKEEEEIRQEKLKFALNNAENLLEDDAKMEEIDAQVEMIEKSQEIRLNSFKNKINAPQDATIGPIPGTKLFENPYLEHPEFRGIMKYFSNEAQDHEYEKFKKLAEVRHLVDQNPMFAKMMESFEDNYDEISQTISEFHKTREIAEKRKTHTKTLLDFINFLTTPTSPHLDPDTLPKGIPEQFPYEQPHDRLLCPLDRIFLYKARHQRRTEVKKMKKLVQKVTPILLKQGENPQEIANVVNTVIRKVHRIEEEAILRENEIYRRNDMVDEWGNISVIDGSNHHKKDLKMIKKREKKRKKLIQRLKENGLMNENMPDHLDTVFDKYNEMGGDPLDISHDTDGDDSSDDHEQDFEEINVKSLILKPENRLAIFSPESAQIADIAERDRLYNEFSRVDEPGATIPMIVDEIKMDLASYTAERFPPKRFAQVEDSTEDRLQVYHDPFVAGLTRMGIVIKNELKRFIMIKLRDLYPELTPDELVTQFPSIPSTEFCLDIANCNSINKQYIFTGEVLPLAIFTMTLQQLQKNTTLSDMAKATLNPDTRLFTNENAKNDAERNLPDPEKAIPLGNKDMFGSITSYAQVELLISHIIEQKLTPLMDSHQPLELFTIPRTSVSITIQGIQTPFHSSVFAKNLFTFDDTQKYDYGAVDPRKLYSTAPVGNTLYDEISPDDKKEGQLQQSSHLRMLYKERLVQSGVLDPHDDYMLTNGEKAKDFIRALQRPETIGSKRQSEFYLDRKSRRLDTHKYIYTKLGQIIPRTTVQERIQRYVIGNYTSDILSQHLHGMIEPIITPLSLSNKLNTSSIKDDGKTKGILTPKELDFKKKTENVLKHIRDRFVCNYTGQLVLNDDIENVSPSSIIANKLGQQILAPVLWSVIQKNILQHDVGRTRLLTLDDLYKRMYFEHNMTQLQQREEFKLSLRQQIEQQMLDMFEFYDNPANIDGHAPNFSAKDKFGLDKAKLSDTSLTAELDRAVYDFAASDVEDDAYYQDLSTDTAKMIDKSVDLKAISTLNNPDVSEKSTDTLENPGNQSKPREKKFSALHYLKVAQDSRIEEERAQINKAAAHGVVRRSYAERENTVRGHVHKLWEKHSGEIDDLLSFDHEVDSFYTKHGEKFSLLNPINRRRIQVLFVKLYARVIVESQDLAFAKQDFEKEQKEYADGSAERRSKMDVDEHMESLVDELRQEQFADLEREAALQVEKEIEELHGGDELSQRFKKIMDKLDDRKIQRDALREKIQADFLREQEQFKNKTPEEREAARDIQLKMYDLQVQADKNSSIQSDLGVRMNAKANVIEIQKKSPLDELLGVDDANAELELVLQELFSPEGGDNVDNNINVNDNLNVSTGQTSKQSFSNTENADNSTPTSNFSLDQYNPDLIQKRLDEISTIQPTTNTATGAPRRKVSQHKAEIRAKATEYINQKLVEDPEIAAKFKEVLPDKSLAAFMSKLHEFEHDAVEYQREHDQSTFNPSSLPDPQRLLSRITELEQLAQSLPPDLRQEHTGTFAALAEARAQIENIPSLDMIKQQLSPAQQEWLSRHLSSNIPYINEETADVALKTIAAQTGIGDISPKQRELSEKLKELQAQLNSPDDIGNIMMEDASNKLLSSLDPSKLSQEELQTVVAYEFYKKTQAYRKNPSAQENPTAIFPESMMADFKRSADMVGDEFNADQSTAAMGKNFDSSQFTHNISKETVDSETLRKNEGMLDELSKTLIDHRDAVQRADFEEFEKLAERHGESIRPANISNEQEKEYYRNPMAHSKLPKGAKFNNHPLGDEDDHPGEELFEEHKSTPNWLDPDDVESGERFDTRLDYGEEQRLEETHTPSEIIMKNLAEAEKTVVRYESLMYQSWSEKYKERFLYEKALELPPAMAHKKEQILAKIKYRPKSKNMNSPEILYNKNGDIIKDAETVVDDIEDMKTMKSLFDDQTDGKTDINAIDIDDSSLQKNHYKTALRAVKTQVLAMMKRIELLLEEKEADEKVQKEYWLQTLRENEKFARHWGIPVEALRGPHAQYFSINDDESPFEAYQRQQNLIAEEKTRLATIISRYEEFNQTPRQNKRNAVDITDISLKNDDNTTINDEPDEDEYNHALEVQRRHDDRVIDYLLADFASDNEETRPFGDDEFTVPETLSHEEYQRKSKDGVIHNKFSKREARRQALIRYKEEYIQAKHRQELLRETLSDFNWDVVESVNVMEFGVDPTLSKLNQTLLQTMVKVTNTKDIHFESYATAHALPESISPSREDELANFLKAEQNDENDPQTLLFNHISEKLPRNFDNLSEKKQQKLLDDLVADYTKKEVDEEIKNEKKAFGGQTAESYSPNPGDELMKAFESIAKLGNPSFKSTRLSPREQSSVLQERNHMIREALDPDGNKTDSDESSDDSNPSAQADSSEILKYSLHPENIDWDNLPTGPDGFPIFPIDESGNPMFPPDKRDDEDIGKLRLFKIYGNESIYRVHPKTTNLQSRFWKEVYNPGSVNQTM